MKLLENRCRALSLGGVKFRPLFHLATKATCDTADNCEKLEDKRKISKKH